MSVSLTSELKNWAYTKIIFLHGSIFCLGIYMSVSMPSLWFWKRLISTTWKNKYLFTTSIWQAIERVHVVYGSWFPWRQQSLLYFGIGGPRLFSRIAATTILKHFVKLGILVYLRRLQKVWSKNDSNTI